MKIKEQEVQSLLKRVYNNKMEENDALDIKEYVTRVFGNGDVSPSIDALHQFNNVVVKMADEIAKPAVTEMLSLLATVKTANRGEVVKYEIPTKNKAKVRWSANGSGVDLHRVEGKKHEVAVPNTFSTGFYYEPFGLIENPIESFKTLVADIANAKVRLFMDQIVALTQAAVASTDIPAANVVDGSNLTLQDYNGVASVLARYGGRPILVADTLMIDHFLAQQATDPAISPFLTDDLKKDFYQTLNPSTIGRTDAMNLVNPFVDAQNNKTELPVNVGYMFAGSVKQKPFVVTTFGSLRQFTHVDEMEDERVKMKLTQEADITLLFGEALGYIKDDSITL